MWKVIFAVHAVTGLRGRAVWCSEPVRSESELLSQPQPLTGEFLRYEFNDCSGERCEAASAYRRVTALGRIRH